MTTEAICDALRAAFGGAWTLRPLRSGSFCETWLARDQAGLRLFLKTAPEDRAAMLHAEAVGLRALAANGSIRTPTIAALADLPSGGSLLALEWLDLRPADAACSARFGEQLATMHAQPQDRFGWGEANFLGATVQVNGWTHSDHVSCWIAFWRDMRLDAMRQRLMSRAACPALLSAVDAVCDALPALFADGHTPRPSLIHGDLWSGNWATDAAGAPVIFDPAVSHSDAEAELAMVELFGSPPSGFWAAYRARYPLHPGYARRRSLYQLYHLLNHALLFGDVYTRKALDCAQDVLGARP
ncbi:fructosamine kinase family protein [Thiomonas sp. FB-Cd]|uniref:fructosamine kinase family protein n=1 Tax=Thiomonas sp. FB-Cd TaxID=1158292 RepID=UPI00056E6D12|nr:fructosamine kinase family protein [Thiomonas sp. FB-Cd]